MRMLANLVSMVLCSAVLFAQSNTIQLRNGANTTTLIAPAGGNYTLTLPASAGTNGQALTTNGSGTLGWSAIASSIDGLSDAKSGGTDFTNSLLLGSEAVAPASGGALRNTGVGLGNTLVTLSTGDDNTAVGYATLASLASGYGITAIGAYALTNAIDASRSVAIGYGAGQTVTSGEYSVFVGYEAGKTFLTGGSSVAVGYRSLYVATGNHNVGVGLETMYTLSSGTTNVAIGNYAGAKITTGSGNVILGYTAGPTSNVSNSLYIDNTETNTPLIYGDFSGNTLTFNGATTTTGTSAINGVVSIGGTTAAAGEIRLLEDLDDGSHYTAFKAQAQAANVTYTLPAADGTSGYYMSTNGSGTLSWAANSLDNLSDAKSGGAQFGSSLILGHQTTGSLTNAEANTAVGYGALESITQGDDNTAIGETALSALTTTERNTAIGAKAMRGATSATWNVFVGAYSGGPFTTNTGDYNVGVGNDVMNQVTSGSNNVAIGYAAGSGLTIGSNNVLLGNSAGSGLSTESNRLYISNSGDATPLIYGEFDTDILRFNGRVGIGGAPGATYELDVVGDINYSGAISNTSDARLKRNIQPLVNAMDVVQRLRPVSYDKRENLQSNDYNMKQMGFIAQELEKVLPNSVSTAPTEDAIKSVDYISLIPVLTKALQEQQQLISNQQAEIDELRQLIKRMSVR